MCVDVYRRRPHGRASVDTRVARGTNVAHESPAAYIDTRVGSWLSLSVEVAGPEGRTT